MKNSYTVFSIWRASPSIIVQYSHSILYTYSTLQYSRNCTVLEVLIFVLKTQGNRFSFRIFLRLFFHRCSSHLIRVILYYRYSLARQKLFCDILGESLCTEKSSFGFRHTLLGSRHFWCLLRNFKEKIHH